MNNPLEIGEKMSTTLYSLWLPITDFSELHANIEIENIPIQKNTNWSWINFKYNDISFTIDSLGFIYLDGVTEDTLLDALKFITKNLNEKTKVNIESTFLNKTIGYIDEADDSTEERELLKFLEKVVTPFPVISNNLLFEQINSSLVLDDKTFLEEDEFKFSLKESNDSFHTILNRNFQSMLKKSIYFTHGLHLEEGELYDLSIIENVYEEIKDKLPELKLRINGECQQKEKELLFKQIIQKVIQDTIEERVILNFLKITKIHYLSKVIDEISINNEILKKLNSYLLEDVKQESVKQRKMKDLDDESATEIFIQNLLQVIPNFYMMDTKVQEAYYIKVGNSTTNLNVKKAETILSTLCYRKWKASINFFIETASKAKESLGMYHQNKTLKELEDISYNANYQADIEDIRELQKTKALSLDGDAKKVLLFIAVVTLAGEAPILTLPTPESLLLNMAYHLAELIFNFSVYFFFLYSIIIPAVRDKENEHSLFEVISMIFSYFTKKIIKTLKREKKGSKKDIRVKAHTFEESDYDKHELRSNRSLYSHNEETKQYEKIFINYNNLVSSYTLVDKLKRVQLSQNTLIGRFSFDLFPQLLRDVPIAEEQEHIYRENYRISGNDRVATKIMYRYKISELRLSKLLDYMEEDCFMGKYAKYLNHEDENEFSIKEAINMLRPHKDYEEESQVTLYIVYSFVLKFYNIEEENKNIFNYTLSKDQFRVHYHTNTMDYTNSENFEKKQTSLAKLIDIYFLKRLKRFKEVELK